MSKTYDQFCPVSRTLDLFGDRWTLLIMRDLFHGKTRFGEFQESLEGIPTNVLSERLKFLEANGIVERTFYSDHPPRAEYSLTPKGRDLHWVLDALAFWGSKYAFEEPTFRHVHKECGHRVTLSWYCPDCEQSAKSSSVDLENLATVEKV